MLLLLRRALPPVLILALFAGLAALLASMKQAPEKKDQSANLPVVEVMAVTSGSHQVSLQSYGVVRAKQQTQLVAEISGRIIELSPEFVRGGVVKAGDILARIEPADYQADLMLAEAQLAQAQAQLQEEVARGKVAEREWHGVVDGIPPELGLRKPQLAKEQANVRGAQAALARAQRNLERTIIRAPFDGLIFERDVELGEYVNISVKLGEVLGTDMAEIRLPVTPADLEFLEIGLGQVELSQQMADHTQTWTAQLVRSEGVVSDENRMVYLVAEIADPYGLKAARDNALKFGTFVNARIAGRELNDLVNLPRHAVKDQRVTIIKSDNTVELRQVNVVHADLEQIYIQGSIKDGERISLNAMSALDNGRKVKVLGESLPEQTADKSGGDASLAVTGG